MLAVQVVVSSALTTAAFVLVIEVTLLMGPVFNLVYS